MQNLTGTWKCSGDGMTYNFTQIENTLYLSGSGNSCANVGFGIINPDEKSITLQWADTPNSRGAGNHGVCYLDASQDGTIVKKAGCPQFAIGNFTK